MRNILIKTSANSPGADVNSTGEIIRFNTEKSFLKLLAIINIISGLFVLQWLFFN